MVDDKTIVNIAYNKFPAKIPDAIIKYILENATESLKAVLLDDSSEGYRGLCAAFWHIVDRVSCNYKIMKVCDSEVSYEYNLGLNDIPKSIGIIPRNTLNSPKPHLFEES